MADGAFDALTYGGRVFFVLALLFLFVFWVRRRWGGVKPGSDGRRLRIIETIGLGPQRQVHVIAVGDRHYLIGATAHTVTLLAPLDEGVSEGQILDNGTMGPTEKGSESDPSFATILKKAEGGTPLEDRQE